MKVVCVDDNEADAALARRSLEATYGALDWQTVVDEAGLRVALAPSAPDIILADLAVPGFDGFVALDVARELRPLTPFIFVSRMLGEEIAVEALKRGATDYIVKNRMNRLLPAVERALREADDHRRAKAAQVALDNQRGLLEGILDAIPDMLYAVDREGRIILGNAAFARSRSDGSTRDMHGGPLSDFFPKRGLGAAIAEDNAALLASNRAYHDRERHWIGDDGEVHWYAVTKVPLHARDRGAVIGLVSLVREITERRNLERSVLEVSEREQRRIGSDLHDGLGQELTGASLLLKSLETEIARDSPQHVQKLRNAQQVVQRAIVSVHSIARGLAPIDLEREGLPGALDTLLKRVQDMHDVKYTINCEGEIAQPLDLTRATHLYRIVQEAASNAACHGRAHHIAVKLWLGSDVVLTIGDDGRGFDVHAIGSAPGMGLRLMRYRASLLGGSINVTSEAAGTRVECQCPANAPPTRVGAK